MEDHALVDGAFSKWPGLGLAWTLDRAELTKYRVPTYVGMHVSNDGRVS